MPNLSKILELDSPNVKIRDRENVEKIITQMINAGKENLQVVSDFDRTISLDSFNGIRCLTSTEVVEESKFIPETFKMMFKAWLDYYLPIEHDHNLTIEEKTPFMIEWWQLTLNLLVKTEITRDLLKQMVRDSTTHVRRGCKTFFQQLDENQIPLLIFSAGLGDVIQEWIEHECGLFSNMKIISNFMEFHRTNKKICGFKGEIIHLFNKNESVLSETDEFEHRIERRGNILLLGDSLGDVTMADGFKGEKNLLKIGFLNGKVDELLPSYMNAFDIVAVHDDTFNIPNAILKAILSDL